ncbi:MAG: nucleoside-triphosphatase [Dehalococcoidia bacterium]
MRILVTGESGCGKTNFCRRIADSARRSGLKVGGVLAPAVHRNGDRVGADAVDLATDESVPIARSIATAPWERDARHTTIFREGLDLARAALERAVRQPFDLIVIDEFGPLELAGGGICQEAVEAWNSGRDVLLVAPSKIADEAVDALGRPPDVRIVPEAMPIEAVAVDDVSSPPSKLAYCCRRPALLALSRAN